MNEANVGQGGFQRLTALFCIYLPSSKIIEHV